jgi:hypothetical protein
MNNPLLKVSLKWALIYTGVFLIKTLGIYLFGPPCSISSILIVFLLELISLITIIVISNKDYRETYLNGYINYSQCLFNSLLVILLGNLMVNIFTFVLYGLDRNSFSEFVAQNISFINENSKYQPEVVLTQLDYYDKLTPLTYAINSFISYTFLSAILSLIVSIFTRKKNNSFEGAIKEIE